MKKSIKNIVSNLSGPTSYCKCIKLCSPATIDHILPQRLLKSRLNNKELKEAINDPHNLFRCCQKINLNKSDKILGEKIVNYVYDGFMSRAYLYMNMKYNLQLDNTLINNWKHISLSNEPNPFEYERDLTLLEITKTSNPYINEFPSSSLNSKM